jgi:replicative DNA helicase
MMHERLRDPNPIIGLDLGPDWKNINFALHGLQNERYGILAAPSGFGKTAIAGAWSKRVAVELGVPTLYLTFETGPETLTDRLISSVSGVESDKIVTGFLNADEVDAVHTAAARIARSPLLITERGIVAEEAIALIRHDVLRRGTKFVVVDYIQLMRGAGTKYNVRRDQELGDISRALLELSHDLGIHMIVLAQINRSGIKGGKPTKEDIGECYKIIQDCDYAFIAYEKSKEEKDADGPDKGDAFGYLDKNRHGKAGVGANLDRDLAVMRIKEAHPRF